MRDTRSVMPTIEGRDIEVVPPVGSRRRRRWTLAISAVVLATIGVLLVVAIAGGRAGHGGDERAWAGLRLFALSDGPQKISAVAAVVKEPCGVDPVAEVDLGDGYIELVRSGSDRSELMVASQEVVAALTRAGWREDFGVGPGDHGLLFTGARMIEGRETFAAVEVGPGDRTGWQLAVRYLMYPKHC